MLLCSTWDPTGSLTPVNMRAKADAMSFDHPRRTDAIRVSATEPMLRALDDLIEACRQYRLPARNVSYRGERQVRIWNRDTAGPGTAIQVGVGWHAGDLWFTRQGRPIARSSNMAETMAQVQSRVRARRAPS
jgi:hypothetical protein